MRRPPAAESESGRVSPGAVVAAGVALVAAVGASIATLPGPSRPLWEVPSSQGSIALYVLALCALALSAVVVSLQPPARARLSPATALVVLTLSWCALSVFARTDAAPAVRLVAAVAASLAPAALLHLTVAITRSPARGARWMVAVAYVVCGVPAFARSLVTEPLWDPFCRVGCDAAGLVVVASPELSQVFGAILRSGSAAVAGTALVIALVGFSKRSGSRTPLAAVAAAALVELVLPLTPAARPGLGSLPEYGELLFVTRCGVAFALALVLIADAVARARRMARLRTRMKRMTEHEETGILQAILAEALGDPALRLDYWLPSLGFWADPAGRAVQSSPSGDTVTITRGGAPVARVALGGTGISAADLEAVVGAAARLVIDNERLRVELRAQARELRASRLRVVEASDAARRRLERDLHDGAQQRLLAASYSFRLAASEASDPLVAAEAEGRLTTVMEVLDTVRETARGVYPPVLADAGLLPALEALAREGGAPLAIDAFPAPFPRLDPALELTAYLVVREAVFAGERPAVTARIAREDGRVGVELSGVAAYRVERVADRVAALGGTVRREGDRLSVEVPCE